MTSFRPWLKNTDKPVTVKIRIGWDKDTINAVETAHAISAAGASAITVHGRTREQYYSGKADWSVIAAVKRAVDIPVVGNGDVTCGEAAMDMMEQTGCDFIMIGRAALGNPWIFREVTAAWKGEEIPSPPTAEEKKAMMIRHLDDLASFKGEYAAVREMRKHVGWYIKGLAGAASFRGKVNQITDIDELRNAIKKYIGGIFIMKYNFDEIIERRHTNALNTDGFRGYIFMRVLKRCFLLRTKNLYACGWRIWNLQLRRRYVRP